MKLTKSDIQAVIQSRTTRQNWKLQLACLAVGMCFAIALMLLSPFDLEAGPLIRRVAWALLSCVPLILLIVLMSKKMARDFDTELAIWKTDPELKAIIEGQ